MAQEEVGGEAHGDAGLLDLPQCLTGKPGEVFEGELAHLVDLDIAQRCYDIMRQCDRAALELIEQG